MLAYVLIGYVVVMWMLGWKFISSELALEHEPGNSILFAALAMMIMWPLVGLLIYTIEAYDTISDKMNISSQTNRILKTFFRLGD